MDVRQMRSPEPAPQPSRPVEAVTGERVLAPAGLSLANKVLVALLIVASLLFIGTVLNRAFAATTAGQAIKDKQYQALFLTNGQVYFGKLSNVNGEYVTLKDIYYLQVQQQVQPKDNKPASEEPQISLAKLGGELHAPEDVMHVSREQVLFWENLKNDGKVATAIKEFQSSNKK
ncbi:hypothetical protein KY386_02900 [Candidatus Parcubacteria bacterium]|nr:hypothetical protein [Candidatus Parcubacteria bacterium]